MVEELGIALSLGFVGCHNSNLYSVYLSRPFYDTELQTDIFQDRTLTAGENSTKYLEYLFALLGRLSCCSAAWGKRVALQGPSLIPAYCTAYRAASQEVLRFIDLVGNPFHIPKPHIALHTSVFYSAR